MNPNLQVSSGTLDPMAADSSEHELVRGVAERRQVFDVRLKCFT
jgi:hypothetical protein